ncbi:MAG: flavin reductase family protein [Planctomycetes bacterium]|nr:flavin reductase family protein [Planctomycetota bacterium]
MELDPNTLDASQRYRLMISGIVPRPIAFVSTINQEGVANLAPFSFFTGIGASPMRLLFCPANQSDGTEKDTLRNAKPVSEGGTGQFVVNVATEAYAREVAAAAEPLAYGESEFNLTGLSMAASQVVKPPRLAESPVAFECETSQVIRLGSNEPGGSNIVMGRVVHIFVRDDLIDGKYHVDPAGLAAIGRMGGRGYCRTSDRFEMPRGRSALAPE